MNMLQHQLPKSEKRTSWLLFLLGLGTMTQINIGGYTAISEFFLVLLMPISLMRNWIYFRRDGCEGFLWLLILWAVGQFCTDLYVRNSIPAMIRGQIPPIGILAALVTIYPLVRRSPYSFRSFLFGVALSGIVSIFIFQPGSIVGSVGVASGQQTGVEATVGYKLFWFSKVGEWLTLPIAGWYLTFPHWLSVFIAAFLSVFALATGGRSAFLVSAFTAFLLFIGKKTQRKMMWIKKNWFLLLIAMAAMGPVLKFAYKQAATSGWMGEEEYQKYEKQAKGKSTLQTLMSGRVDFFIALEAIKDHPIIGHGSYAMDTHGYIVDFLHKYGEPKEADAVEELRNALGAGVIPSHSHIMTYWLWGGLRECCRGFIFWCCWREPSVNECMYFLRSMAILLCLFLGCSGRSCFRR